MPVQPTMTERELQSAMARAEGRRTNPPSPAARYAVSHRFPEDGAPWIDDGVYALRGAAIDEASAPYLSGSAPYPMGTLVRVERAGAAVWLGVVDGSGTVAKARPFPRVLPGGVADWPTAWDEVASVLWMTQQCAEVPKWQFVLAVCGAVRAAASYAEPAPPAALGALAATELWAAEARTVDQVRRAAALAYQETRRDVSNAAVYLGRAAESAARVAIAAPTAPTARAGPRAIREARFAMKEAASALGNIAQDREGGPWPPAEVQGRVAASPLLREGLRAMADRFRAVIPLHALLLAEAARRTARARR